MNDYVTEQPPVEVKFEGNYKLKALSHWALVEPEAPEALTPGGIIIPEMFQGKSRVGTVLDVGPGRATERGILPPSVHNGQKVIYGAYAGTPYEINGRDLLLMRTDEIIMALEAVDD